MTETEFEWETFVSLYLNFMSLFEIFHVTHDMDVQSLSPSSVITKV